MLFFDKKKKKEEKRLYDHGGGWSQCVPTLDNCSEPISVLENRRYFNTGVGRKIVDIKTSYSLNKSLVFENESDQKKYLDFELQILKAVESMIAFGLSAIILGDDDDLETPISRAFEAQAFTPEIFSIYENEFYIHNKSVHPSRIVFFEYHSSRYKNIFLSEFDIIGKEIFFDEKVKKYAIEALKKNTTIFYKIEGLASQLVASNAYHQGVSRRFSIMENLRSIFGASLIDKDHEDVISVPQTLPDLEAVDSIALRRLAMVTRIPLPMLVGEAVQGLNSSGNVEMVAFDDMIRQIQHRFLTAPLKVLFEKIGIGNFTFKRNFRDETSEILSQENQIIQNAIALQDLGFSPEQINNYLRKYEKKLGFEF